jgi:hypothetical protein
MADKNEIDATTEVMKLCNVCELPQRDNCMSPCGAARAMLLAFNLEYKG